MAVSAKSSSSKGVMEQLEYYLVTKAPVQLPANVKEIVVKFLPWVNLVLLVLLAPAVLLALGIGTLALPFSVAGGVDAAGGLTLSLIALLAQIVLMVAALPGLFNRRKSGWNLAFYSVLVNLLYGFLMMNIIGSLVSAVLEAYVLFQVRSSYK